MSYQNHTRMSYHKSYKHVISERQQINRKMYPEIDNVFNSDRPTKQTNVAMEASNTFKNLLQQVKCSHLNFKLELSPFSAVISLKKSFIKDKIGNTILPPSSESSLREENKTLSQKILHQENVLQSLKTEYERAVDECKAVHKVNKVLELSSLEMLNKKHLRTVT